MVKVQVWVYQAECRVGDLHLCMCVCLFVCASVHVCLFIYLFVCLFV